MSNYSKYWIVTDLDGTLMEENYDISSAKKTLNLLSELNIPVIPCTSKTASEVRYFRKENALTDPFIVENGAAIYGNYVNNSSEWELILGKSYAELRYILKNISKGDKRVFIINGKVCGAISRVPKKGSYLSNMSKGAVPKLTSLTKKEIRISKIIGKKLKKDNIYFAGIDFIDQQLNGDINVTSPTGLKTYYDLSKINLAKTFWKGLKA